MIHPLLNVRTDFSLGESIIGIDDLVSIADKAGTDIVGVCETMSVSSLVEGSKTLKKAGKRMLLGVRVRVIMQEDSGKKADQRERASYFKLYPTNEKGLRSLYRLLSRGFDANRFYYVPRVTWDDCHELLESDCFAITTGDIESVIQREDMRGGLAGLLNAKRFTASFYELVPSETPYYSRQNKLAIEFGEELTATHPSICIEPVVMKPAFWIEDAAETFSVAAGISERRYYADYLRPVPRYEPHTPKDLAQATVRAAHAVEGRYGASCRTQFLAGIQNTKSLVDVCQYEWKKLDPSLPNLASDADEALKELCKQGWKDRFGRSIFGHKPDTAELSSKYLPRLQFELATLKQLGFAGYFLLVSDLVRWSKSQDIYVGPGRGSVGGSLVAYLVGITDVDPIRFDLLFERFINPDRLDLPDADLDFMSTRRQEVIDYLIAKYGEGNVAGIVNYNTMAARSAIRDAGRVYNLTGSDLEITKFISSIHGISLTLEEAHEQSADVQAWAQQHPKIWGHALKLEGKMRSFGTHAAGVVVAGEPLTNRAVVEQRGGARVINWDKRVSEDQGLIKLDVLGLSTLDMFDQAISLIFKRHSKKLDINSIPLDDAKTLEIFNEAKTAGVFQFEGGSVRRLLKEMANSKPLTFEDLVALNALNRPGPLDAGLTESYIRRRAGDELVTYPHPSLEQTLKPTYGVLCYQEQVMQTARVLCGFAPGEADTLRKAMGKKDPVMMAQQRDKFVQGAVSVSGMAAPEAEALFDMIERFAGYAFNRSHAVEYTLIAYQAAYIKAHYLVEFYTASMGIASDDKLAPLVKQAAVDGIRVVPPDVNISTDVFEPLNDTIIAAPLSVIKGLSERGAKAIIEARSTAVTLTEETGRGKNKVTTTRTLGPGRFTSIENFRERVPARAVNSAVMEKLDKVGAFARIEPGQLPSMHKSRQRDQIEIMPAISDQGVQADRKIVVCDETWNQLCDNQSNIMDIFGDQAVDLKVGKDPKLMIVIDAPFDDYQDVHNQWSYINYVEPAMRAVGLTLDDVIWTYVLRRPKRKGERDFPKDEVRSALPFLKREIEILKPPVVVLMGPTAIRSFFPDLKGLAEHVGHKTYSAELDATVIIGFNPAQIYHDAEKIEPLKQIFTEAKNLVESN
jgi:DNA polymerase III subunit alpha